MNNSTITEVPLTPAEAQALHKRFQAIEPLLTGWDGLRRKTALESKRLGIRNTCYLIEREFPDEPVLKLLNDADTFIIDELNNLLTDVETLAQNVKAVAEHGRIECREILERFAGYEQAVRTTYAQVLELEAKYRINLRKDRQYYN